jgi:hypothetical protein
MTAIGAKVLAVDNLGAQYRAIFRVEFPRYRGSFQTLKFGEKKPFAASKAATGGTNWDEVKTWRETGKITLGGLEGTYEAWFDFPDVRTALTFKLGPAKGAQGWNGKESWSTDASNQLRVETSQEAIANAVKSAYQGVHSFYFPGRYPAELKYGGAKDNDGNPCDVIVCKPKDSDPFEVWFDQTTHYLVKMVDLTGERPQTTYFSDFRQFKALTIPFKTKVSIGDPKYDSTVDSQEIELNGTVAAARMASDTTTSFSIRAPPMWSAPQLRNLLGSKPKVLCRGAVLERMWPLSASRELL